MSSLVTYPLPRYLDMSVFPAGTPLNAFFAWNEARYLRDRRYVVACDIHRLLQKCNGDVEICLAHLVSHPVIVWRAGRRIAVSAKRIRSACRSLDQCRTSPAAVAGGHLISALVAAIGTADETRHAAVFRAFEDLAQHVNLTALARLRSARKITPLRAREILVIKLGALGDFVQALGPMPDIRRHHAADHITLLTTSRYADLASQTGLFDKILVDDRPTPLDLGRLRFLRRTLRRGRFDRVYDFQTSDRTALYAWLFAPGPMPEWSGIVWRCSHPHANVGRDRQHTMDRQAQQLLMAGVYPVARVPWLPSAASSPASVAGKRFAILIPGSSPRHPAKRWPTANYGELARRLRDIGYLPVLVGVADEGEIGCTIRKICPEVVDMIGGTDVAELAALAQAAVMTIGNDTGATHVAAAGGNPVVTLFSAASDPRLCAPRGKAVRVLQQHDLADMTVERVLAACMEIVADPARELRPTAS